MLRLLLLAVILVGVVGAGYVLYTRWLELQRVGELVIDGASPDLSVAERLYLQTYLSTRVEQLRQPAGTATEAVAFTVSPGETADTIARNLQAAGLLSDVELFRNYVRFYGLDSQLEAGDFMLPPQLTVPELAQTLTDGRHREIRLRFLEGWRMEEMVHYLAQTTPAQIDADAFLALAQRKRPFATDRYDFLASLPADVALEGYLFPDTYTAPPDATAEYLVDAMLQNFGERVDPALRQQFGAQGLTLREAVTLASIVEREAAVAAERPLIAAVFLNRLAQGIPLQADPTVQYAVGRQPNGNWWKSPLSQADLQLDSPYNTYVYSGVPPGPIANPGLSSLQAVATPARVDYLFFVANCDTIAAGEHVFSATYEEHLANVERCR